MHTGQDGEGGHSPGDGAGAGRLWPPQGLLPYSTHSALRSQPSSGLVIHSATSSQVRFLPVLAQEAVADLLLPPSQSAAPSPVPVLRTCVASPGLHPLALFPPVLSPPRRPGWGGMWLEMALAPATVHSAWLLTGPRLTPRCLAVSTAGWLLVTSSPGGASGGGGGAYLLGPDMLHFPETVSEAMWS